MPNITATSTSAIPKTPTSVQNSMIYFVPPVMNTFMNWGQTMMVILFILTLFAVIIFLYLYVNFDEYKTRISVISLASFFGRDPQAMFQSFIQNAQAESIATAMNNIQATTQDINTTTYRLDDQSTLLSRQMVKDVPDSNAESNSLGMSIQKGIAQIRDSVSKLGGALVLNNYMSKGAVQTTQSPTAKP